MVEERPDRTRRHHCCTPPPLTKPKQREIFAADVRDRVVHHLLVGHLEPFWERRFIHDSYACRQGKGTHQAVERLRAFTRQVTANGTRRAWYLQRDVRGFFIILDRHILFQQLAAQERDPAVHWLLRVILCQDLTATWRFRHARRADFERLPPHKTLFKAQPGCGLPIGNLTSQFFSDRAPWSARHPLAGTPHLGYSRAPGAGWQHLRSAFLISPRGAWIGSRPDARSQGTIALPDTCACPVHVRPYGTLVTLSQLAAVSAPLPP